MADKHETYQMPMLPLLTKREYFAGRAPEMEVNGIMVFMGWNKTTDALTYAKQCADARLMWADALLAALEDSHGS
jgi:hypothetical protein